MPNQFQNPNGKMKYHLEVKSFSLWALDLIWHLSFEIWHLFILQACRA
jgi:hypothetical protein